MTRDDFTSGPEDVELDPSDGAPTTAVAREQSSVLMQLRKGTIVDGKYRLLAIAQRCGKPEGRRAETAKIRDDHPIARLGKHWPCLRERQYVIGPAVKKDHRGTATRPDIDVPDTKLASIDLGNRAVILDKNS